MGHLAIYYTSPLLSYIYGVYLKDVLVRQTKWLDQIPGKSRLWIKITEYLKGLITIAVDNFVQSWHVDANCFVALTIFFQLNLTVVSFKLYWARAVVPDADGLRDFIAGSSIQTRVALTAAIGERDVINTGIDAVVPLMKKKKTSTTLCILFPLNISGNQIKRMLNYHQARASSFPHIFFVYTLRNFYFLLCFLRN